MCDSRPFHMRHFSLHHHRSTMKVGTDAVILGAWVDLTGLEKILDVGTGCGILAMMLAQRSNAQIDALDIDLPSVREASENFAASQWRDKMNAYHADYVSFPNIITHKYDLIVSNPPFFTSVFKTTRPRRNLARHTDTLSFETMVATSAALLTENGCLAVVLPDTEAPRFLDICTLAGLNLKEQLNVVPVEGRLPNRLNMVFAKQKPKEIISKQFTIRYADGNFTEEYKDLLRDFYLGL